MFLSSEAYNLAQGKSVCLMCVHGVRVKANSAEYLTAAGIMWWLVECSFKFFQHSYV